MIAVAVVSGVLVTCRWETSIFNLISGVTISPIELVIISKWFKPQIVLANRSSQTSWSHPRLVVSYHILAQGEDQERRILTETKPEEEEREELNKLYFDSCHLWKEKLSVLYGKQGFYLKEINFLLFNQRDTQSLLLIIKIYYFDRRWSVLSYNEFLSLSDGWLICFSRRSNSSSVI